MIDNVLIVFCGLTILAILVLLVRLIGAWMLRINDVIKIQKETLEEIKKISNNQKNQN